jgi:quinol monooxygenase YgiN
MSDFFVMVTLYAKEGREQELRESLTPLVAASRKDEGNLRYELFVQQDDPRRFVFVEHWASPDAQEKHHTESDHIVHFNNNGVGAVERTEVAYFLNRIE